MENMKSKNSTYKFTIFILIIIFLAVFLWFYKLSIDYKKSINENNDNNIIEIIDDNTVYINWPEINVEYLNYSIIDYDAKISFERLKITFAFYFYEYIEYIEYDYLVENKYLILNINTKENFLNNKYILNNKKKYVYYLD